jgi:hypothetical protein
MSARQVHVDVIIDDPTSNPPKFHFETTDLPMGPGNQLYFQNCGHPGLHVHYFLKDGKGYQFPPNNERDEAVSAQTGAGCPAQGVHWPVFRAQRVTQDQQTLVVHNKNPKVEDFSYTLFVTNNGGTSYLPLDPGGTNQNGQTSIVSMSTSMLVIGTAVLTVAALYTFDFLGRQ